jgi:hypothetical protein
MWSPLITRSSVHDCDALVFFGHTHGALTNQPLIILYIVARVEERERAWDTRKATHQPTSMAEVL